MPSCSTSHFNILFLCKFILISWLFFVHPCTYFAVLFYSYSHTFFSQILLPFFPLYCTYFLFGWICVDKRLTKTGRRSPHHCSVHRITPHTLLFPPLVILHYQSFDLNGNFDPPTGKIQVHLLFMFFFTFQKCLCTYICSKNSSLTLFIQHGFFFQTFPHGTLGIDNITCFSKLLLPKVPWLHFVQSAVLEAK